MCMCMCICLIKVTGFYQFVDFATRGSNILDIILADDDQIITVTTPGLPIGLSDHLTINFTLTLETAKAISNSVLNTIRYSWLVYG